MFLCFRWQFIKWTKELFLPNYCPDFTSFVGVKYLEESNLWRKGFIWVGGPNYSHHCEESSQIFQTATCFTSKIKSKEMHSNVCLLNCALLNFSTIIQFKTTCLWNATAHSGMSLPTSINSAIPYRHIQRPIWFRKLLFQSDSSLFQVGR